MPYGEIAMPYEIKPIGGEFCVFRVGSNDSLGCHESREDANRQIAAIEANEKASKQFKTGFASISLENNIKIMGLAELCRILLDGIIDIEYTPSPLYHITLAYGQNVSIEVLQAISQSFSFSCFDLEITKFDIFKNQGKQYLVALCDLSPDLFSLQVIIYSEMVRQGIDVSNFHMPHNYKPHITIAELEENEIVPLDTLNQLLGSHRIHIDKVVFSVDDYRPVAITHAVELFSPEDFDLMSPKSMFKILSDNDWLAWYTNNFEDKEGEIISEAALRKFVDGTNNGEYPMPELWFHHIQGTRHGIAKQLFQVGHFTVAYGEFDDVKSNKFVAVMKSWYDKQEFITMSHWFFFGDKSDGNIYEDIRTFEISTLPATREANAYTKFVMR